LDKDKERDERYVPGGNVLVARAILESRLWRWNPEHLRLWIYLLTSVNASEVPRVFSSVSVGYGQVLKSYRRIAEECEYEDNNRLVRWHPSRVERMLKRFEASQMVALLRTDLGTLITVRNFKMYQDFDTYRRRLGTGLGTATGQQQDNNKQSNQSNQLLTTELWEVFIDELGGEKPHPSLTPKRRDLLARLYSEQLLPRCREMGTEPPDLFRRICRSVKASDHHMSQSQYQLPESLFKTAERRERWTLDGISENGTAPRTGPTFSRAPRAGR